MNVCEEITHPNANTLEILANKNDTPVVIRNAVSDWPSVIAAKQSTESIQALLLAYSADHPVLAYQTPPSENGRIFYQKDFEGMNFTREMHPLEEVFKRLNNIAYFRSGDGIYMGSTNLERHFPGFKQSNSMNFGIPPSGVSANLWLGNQTQVAAHFDYPNNFACCVAGKRTFRLFPPDQLSNLYVGPLSPTPGGPAVSLVDGKQPDYKAYPKYQNALRHSYTTTLRPGDVLFIPSMWWHEVNALSSFNVLVNYWWKPTPNHIPSPQVALDAALLTLRDLPKAQKNAWKTLFDYYIFSDESFDHIPDKLKGALGGIDEKQAMQLRTKLLNALNR